MINKYIKTAFVLSAAFLATGCDFEEKNTDPNNSTSIDAGHLLTYTQLNTCTDANTKNMQVGTCMMLVQQTATLETTEASAGDKYYQMHTPANAYFKDFYSDALKNWREMEVQTLKNPEDKNMLAVVKIWGAFLFQRMTDLYGDVPYSEAGLGFYNHIFTPEYETQESIYKDMISQIQSGLELFDASKPAIRGDLFYNGDINQWKKFGNSLLLRVGMRLSKVDPTLAASTVKQAIAGGIMDSPKDICMVKHIAGGRDYDKNPMCLRFQKDNYIKGNKVKISETFMNYLKKTADPRINVFCSMNDGSTPANQIGLPNGFDQNTINFPAGMDINSYSTFNTNTIMRMDAPTLFLMPSESKLLQAEAALRGWVTGDPAALFKEAVTLSMKEQQEAYGPVAAISDADINAYLAQDLFGQATTQDEKLEVLGTQYWIVTFMNGFESYANWRRCGYPKLTPTNFPQNESNGQIPRRIPYAGDEYTNNKANVDAAVKHQGPDKVTTRIWWDK